MEGIGPIVARQIATFLGRRATRQVIRRLLERGLHLAGPSRRAGTPLTGKAVVFTGTLDSMSRDEAEALVTKLGGHAGGAVSARTDFVVAGANPGSKYDRATALGLRILTEDGFLDLVRRR